MRVFDFLNTIGITKFNIITYNDGSRYEGEVKDGIRHGKGKYFYKNGSIYEGEWVNGNRTGTGIFKGNYGYMYDGEWRNNYYHGKGDLQDGDGSLYSGEWLNGEKNGYGVEQFVDDKGYKCSYTGEFKNGKYNGKGKMIWIKNDLEEWYEGEYVNGLREGKGVCKFSNGEIYEGEWCKGSRTGSGIYRYNNGNVYDGLFKNSKIMWEGMLYKDNGTAERYKNKELIAIYKYVEEKDYYIMIKNIVLDRQMNKINKLIGLNGVKNEIRSIVNSISFEKKRSLELGIEIQNQENHNFMFTGNPGTGKTTVARLLGGVFKSLDILEKGHVVECDRSKLVSQYKGETAIKTKEVIESAMGGILFIDEAYTLMRSKEDSLGLEVIDTLMKAMEDYRDKFIVILAGYTKEMNNLMKSNPGLKGRIGHLIKFDDFDDDELLKIAHKNAEEKYYKLSKSGEKAFLEIINKKKVDEKFANAREVRNIIDYAIREKAKNIGNKDVSSDELIVLRDKEFGVDINKDCTEGSIEFVNKLDSLVGLNEAKSIIKRIISFVQLQQKRKEMGLSVEELSLNMFFLGNPGTGKTTIARLLAKVLKSMGILKIGHLVEVTRENLVGEYVGHTAPKTLAKIKEAYGGILFIDEAYSLVVEGSSNDFGEEALATLIKEMEDNRDKLIVIMAGYPEKMNKLLNINPGLSSRIGFKINFEDYKAEEMIEIFKGLCKKERYTITNEAENKMLEIFKEEYKNKDENYGNARLARVYFNKIKMNQAERVMKINDITKEKLLEISHTDIF